MSMRRSHWLSEEVWEERRWIRAMEILGELLHMLSDCISGSRVRRPLRRVQKPEGGATL